MYSNANTTELCFLAQVYFYLLSSDFSFALLLLEMLSCVCLISTAGMASFTSCSFFFPSANDKLLSHVFFYRFRSFAMTHPYCGGWSSPVSWGDLVMVLLNVFDIDIP